MSHDAKVHVGMTVAELMSTDVQTTTETETVRDVHGAMRVAGIRHMPVLDAAGTLVGIVSDRDLHLAWSRGPETRVSEVMSRNMHWVHPTSSARDAAARMLQEKIGCLPVLDEQRRIVGIITETDFVSVAHRALTLLSALNLEEAS